MQTSYCALQSGFPLTGQARDATSAALLSCYGVLPSIETGGTRRGAISRAVVLYVEDPDSLLTAIDNDRASGEKSFVELRNDGDPRMLPCGPRQRSRRVVWHRSERSKQMR
jgi:hypothetical protein